MSNEAESLILADAAVDATEEGRRGLLGRRRKRKGDRVLTNCENCGTSLTGEYCSNCGQHAIDYKRSLWRVLIDAADSFLNWDTKFLSSLGLLLIKPWRLTNDFNAGRRARYVHPLRLYLLASIAFFLMTKLVHINDKFVLDPKDRTEISAALAKLTGPDSSLPPDQQAKIDSIRARIVQANGAISSEERADLKNIVNDAINAKIRERMSPEERARIKAAVAMIPRAPKPPKAPATPASPNESAPGSPPAPAATPALRSSEPIDVELGDSNEPKSPRAKWLKNVLIENIGEGGTKSKLFLETLRNNIPTMMLCCVPLFALVLKVLYFRKRRYYVEHLVYALHIHSFAYVGVTLITLLGIGIARFSQTARVLTVVFLSLVIFGQVFLSIRRVYGQGWFFTTFKFLVGGFAYFVILICAVGVTAFVTMLGPELMKRIFVWP